MSDNYFIGYDASKSAQAAIDFAAKLAKGTGASLTAICAYPPPPRVFGRGASDGADAELTALAEADAALVMAELHDSAVASRLLRPGSPPQALIEAAEDEPASLIVVGATHRGPLGRVSPGSTAERLLHGAPCPVAVVPATADDPRLESIAVAYDGLPESEAAVTYAAGLAAALDVPLELLGVETPVVVTGAYGGFDCQGQIHDGLEEMVSERAEKAGATWRLLYGSAGPTLADASENVDLMVTGSRGYGPWRAVLLGGTSRYLADHASCPVVVVPRPDRETVAASESDLAAASA
jgi:nucleotide-binding universal stress UspA family protein